MTPPDPARLERWRDETPGCRVRNHLNNAGAALMPAKVLAAIQEHLRLEAEIGGYEAEAARMEALDQGYEDLAALLGTRARNIAVVANATAGFVQALSAFDFAPGDVILTSRCDYTSNQIQYLALRQRTGVEIVHAPDLPEGGIDPQAVREILRSRRCRLVALSWVPTNSGLVQEVEAVGEVCETAGVPYLVDACQAVGQIPIAVERLRCDYLSATARKFLRGPRGIGLLYASDRALARGDYPLYVDMRGARWVAPGAFEVLPTARRFEDWEFPHALVLGQGAAARYALEVGIATAQAAAWRLAARLREGLAGMPGVRVLDRGRTRCALVTLTLAGVEADRLVRELAARRINVVATRREFAIYDFDEKGVRDGIRVSPHYYNSDAEIDEFLACIRSFADASGSR